MEEPKKEKAMNKRIKKKKGIYTRFKDRETWDLGYTVAAFTLPRLRRFKKLNNGIPGCLLIESDGTTHFNDEEYQKQKEIEWDTILDHMIWSFEQIITSDEEPSIYNYKDNWNEYCEQMKIYNEQIQDGLNLFGKYFRNLWW